MTTPTVKAGADSAWVQIPTEGSGKYLGHIAVYETQTDGTTKTVWLPRMVACDSEGTPLDVTVSGLQQAIEHLSEEITLLRQTMLLTQT